MLSCCENINTSSHLWKDSLILRAMAFFKGHKGSIAFMLWYFIATYQSIYCFYCIAWSRSIAELLFDDIILFFIGIELTFIELIFFHCNFGLLEYLWVIFLRVIMNNFRLFIAQGYILKMWIGHAWSIIYLRSILWIIFTSAVKISWI